MAYENLKAKIPEEGWKCKKSCGRCCTNTAPVGESEANEIIEWLNKNKSTEELTAQFHHFDGAPGSCPFLQPDKGCFVYPVRPVVCRTFGHLEDVPGLDKKASQKCPEGVEFTEVKFIDIADESIAWMAEVEERSIRTIQFRFLELDEEDLKGMIPVLPGSALEKLQNTSVCTRCGKPFSDNNAYLEGADLLCYGCGGTIRA